MSLPRRAIIHIGGSKNRKFKLTDIEPRKLKLLQSINPSLFSGEGTKYSFTLDPRLPPKNKKITDFVDINSNKNIKTDHKVPVYDIFIGSDEEINKIDEKEKQKILAETQEIKNKIREKYRKKDEKTKERKELGMGKLLQEIEFDIDYYKDINNKFKKFEEKFFLPETEENKYNPFRFKVSENYKNIEELPEDKREITTYVGRWIDKQSLSVISNPIKKLLILEFDQIMKDVYRNAVSFMGRNYGLHAQNTNKEQAYFNIIQMALFKSYMFYADKNIHYTYNKYDFTTSMNITGNRKNTLRDDAFIKDIYRRNEKKLSINYNVLEDIISKKLKREEERIERIDGEKNVKLDRVWKTIWAQMDTSMFISALFVTSKENHTSIFNKEDAIALYCYTMIENKIEDFVKFKDFDSKLSYKMSLKLFSLLKFVDPYIFTKHDILLHEARQKDKNRKKVGTLKKEVKHLDDMKMGESFFYETDLFDAGKKKDKEKWLEEERDKYNIFKEKELTIEQIADEIEKNSTQKDNKNYEAFLLVSKLEEESKILYSERYVSLEENKFFDSGETAMNYYDIVAKWLINMFIFTNGPHIGLMDRFNASNDTVKHFWKCIHKYGVDGLILYWGIHMKNMRSAYYLNNKPNNNPMKKINKNGQLMKMFVDTGDRNIYRTTLTMEGPMKRSEMGLLETGEGDRWITDHKNKKTFVSYIEKDFETGKEIKKAPPNPHTFRSGVFLNPLTANVNETYVKHFNYCLDIIEKKHGSMKNFNKEFDKLFNKSLILYKNGYMKQSRLDTLKKEHPGITVVNNLSEIWEKYKNDKRIYFEKNKRHSIEKIKAYDKGWLGNLRGNILSNALDGIYHIDFRKFINDSRNILPPFVKQWHFEEDLIKEYRKHELFEIPENMNKGWPKDSGRPFIFVNHIKALEVEKDEDKQIWRFNKKIYSINEIKKKMNSMKISRIQMPGTSGIFPSYWFPEPKNPFKRVDKNNHIKLKYLIEHGEEKYNKELENMNKAMKIKGKPILVKKPVVKESPDKLPEKDEEPDLKPDLNLERKDSDTPPSSVISSVDSGELIDLRNELERQEKENQDTDRRADELCKNMDDLISSPDDKFERVKELVSEDKTPEDIIKIIQDEFKGTFPVTITCMIDAVKRNQEMERQKEGTQETDEVYDQSIKSPKGPDQQLRDMGLERVKVKDDGDCLFAAFLYIMNPKRDEPPKKAEIMEIRDNVVDYITLGGKGVERKTVFHGQEIVDTTSSFWETYGDKILTVEHLTDVGKMMYEPLESDNFKWMQYAKCMTSEEGNPNNPRCRFGGPVEIKGWEEMTGNKIQVIEWMSNKWEVKYPETASFDEKKHTLIFDRQKLHYDYARPIQQSQKGGGNNVYINKCKNHRHKRTRKFRIRLKNVGDWVHVKKPKKRTRRIY